MVEVKWGTENSTPTDKEITLRKENQLPNSTSHPWQMCRWFFR